MNNIIIFFLSFYFILLSVLGYGILFHNLCFDKIKNLNGKDSHFVGFYGLLFITLISIITSLFVPHNFIHNSLLHFFGVIFFFFSNVGQKKQYLKFIFLISLFTLSALLISKTHDDFSYYHLPFTKYLTEQKIIFGMSNLSHGYKLLSSLFFLNSTYYLPFIGYYSFHFSLLFFLIFFNYYLLKEIIHKNTHEVIRYLFLFAFLFFNLSFNRIAEYGTDKAGQLLIVILVIKLFQLTYLKQNQKNIKNILFLIPLLGFCISLKTYFLTYILFFLVIFFFKENFFKVIKAILFSKATFAFLILLTVYFLHHFISTGCIISPISITCFGDNLDWAKDGQSYKRLSLWLEQWAKAGAGPDFRVEDPLTYIQNFNWISGWFNNYFVGKVSDQLLILTLVFIISFFLFKSFAYKKNPNFINKKILIFYLIILAIFFIWFYKHPALRYGGYSIVFLTLSIPLALFFHKFNNNLLFKKRLKLIIVLVILIFNFKNFKRINDEIQRTDQYQFKNFPFFTILEKKYNYEKTPSGLIIYKTNGHCWGTPSPCVQSMNKLSFDIKIRNGYYFLIN